MSETKLVREIQLNLSNGYIRLFRNNVGVLQDKNGQHVTYGLCKGSSDLIGWKTISITPEMVGEKVAVFCALEVKTPKGRLTHDQQFFLDIVNMHGGYAHAVRSLEEARQVLNLYDDKVTVP